MVEFKEFPKLARLNRECIITEKIDGTNAQVYIEPVTETDGEGVFAELHGVTYRLMAGSRNRWVKVGDDNYGFAGWVAANKDSLVELGPGHHYGEWWGKGIQRNYGLITRHFSLFNTVRWGTSRPACCDVVPVLYQGPFCTEAVKACVENLRTTGSYAAKYPDPEGVVVFHVAANIAFKVTCKDDDKGKTHREANARGNG